MAAGLCSRGPGRQPRTTIRPHLSRDRPTGDRNSCTATSWSLDSMPDASKTRPGNRLSGSAATDDLAAGRRDRLLGGRAKPTGTTHQDPTGDQRIALGVAVERGGVRQSEVLDQDLPTGCRSMIGSDQP